MERKKGKNKGKENLEERLRKLDEESEIQGLDIDLEEAYSSSIESLKEGQVVKGKVLRIVNDEVIIDINYKSEGTVPLRQFADKQGKINVEPGNRVEVFLEKIENQNGLIVLSKEKAEYMVTWAIVVSSHENQKAMDGKIVRQVKGGFEVDIGVKAFLPASQLDVRPVQNLSKFIGGVFPMKVIKINRALNNIVLSRRIVLEGERESKRQEILSTLEEGQLREGIVKNITPFGAFVDLGGVDGLLHITDMSWGKTKHPSEKVSLGDNIEVKIINYDKEKGKISLGLKQKISNPWDTINEKYKVGQIVDGKVTSLMDYGAFVEIEEGAEGLIHNSEMSWIKRITHPSQVLKIGQVSPVVILNIDKDNRRLSLGLKQTQPNPWETISENYPIGSKVKCTICNITDFGAFAELEKGIEGLIHISDISWTKKIKHTNEEFKIGDTVDVIVLNIDRGKEKISLGVKQVNSDPFSEFEKKYKEKEVMSVKVSETTPNFYLVKLEEDLTGIIPFSELSEEIAKKDKEKMVGKKLDVKIKEIDIDRRQIVLSQKEFDKEEEKKLVEEYNKDQGEMETTLAEAVKKSLKKKTAKKVAKKKEAAKKDKKKTKKEKDKEKDK